MGGETATSVAFVIRVHKRRKESLPYPTRTVHTGGCRYASRRGRAYVTGLAEVTRLFTRVAQGDDGRTHACAYCAPARWAFLLTEST